jgi:hypothetical protein
MGCDVCDVGANFITTNSSANQKAIAVRREL